ncbi:MAG: MucR family transcriptional regulator [Alphaproteobacteria bacterium]
MPDRVSAPEVLRLTVDIVSAHVAQNTMPPSELPQLIAEVHASLAELSRSAANEPILEPAVPITKSVTPDYIVCLEDGRKLKMLKRHLKTAYNLTPEQYRERWGLPANYPLVAPNYAKQRSKLAKKIELGRRGGARR